ncbi:MAG: 16S rRNA (cytosine(967)-C(5))-methyltransferase [Microcystaceae cyanobacterium]
MNNARQVAFNILQTVDQQQTYTDIALDRGLQKTSLTRQDRGFVTELVYGIVRRQRSLDTLIDQLAQKPSDQQPPKLRYILHIGLYQLRYLTQVPPSAAVNTSVELGKNNGLKGLSGVINGILRKYIRLTEQDSDPLQLPSDLIQRLGILYSFPDWLIQLWVNELGEKETESLCQWFNQVPTIDLRINPLKISLNTVKEAFDQQNIAYTEMADFPQALRLTGSQRQIQQLPYFQEGGWTVQEISAQLVGYLLDPQPNEVIVDACAAPGGKTTHLAELMQDQGVIWGCDRYPSRLKKIQHNIERLQLNSIRLQAGDSRNYPQFRDQCDRVLLDVPCSGLGTLHRHPDIRWRQNPDKIAQLTQLQEELLTEAATWVKTEGVLVYATCTLNQSENEDIVQNFLKNHPEWRIELPDAKFPLFSQFSQEGWLKIWPHHQQMDGFFMVKLRKLFEAI